MSHADKKITRLEEAENLMNQIMEKGEHAEEEIKKYADSAEKYIKKHPVKSTIIAGVAGLLLGKFLAR